MSCLDQHDFQYQGEVTWIGHPLAGTSARTRFYASRYYCRRCLEVRLLEERQLGDTYMPIRFGAVEIGGGA